MLEKIKEAVFSTYNPEEQKGVFFSAYDRNKGLVLSAGVLNTDKSLHVLLETLYTEHLADHLSDFTVLTCDIVSEIIDIANMEEILALSPEEFGFALISVEEDTSGVILPNTTGVSDAKAALYYLKQKYAIHGKAEVFVFRTERLVITK